MFTCLRRQSPCRLCPTVNGVARFGKPPVATGKMQTFGERLRAAREKRGLDQEQLGEKLGHKDGTQVSRWESDARAPRLHQVVALVEVLGIDGGWLLTGEGRPEPRRPGEAEARLEAVELVLGGQVDPADVIELATVDEGERERLRELYRRAQELGELDVERPGAG